MFFMQKLTIRNLLIDFLSKNIFIETSVTYFTNGLNQSCLSVTASSYPLAINIEYIFLFIYIYNTIMYYM